MTRILLSLLILVVSSSTSNIFGQTFNDFIPKRHYVIPSFSADSLRKSMGRRPLHHIEGIWSFPGTGVSVAIESHRPDNIPETSLIDGYRLIILSSPNRAIRPGTVIGHITSSAVANKYDARIYTSMSGITISGPKRFTLTLDSSESRIVFQKHKSTYSINLWRMLPYIFRHIIRKNEAAPSIYGCVRTYPAPAIPLEPIYL